MVGGLTTLRTYDRIFYYRQLFVDDLEKSTNITFAYFATNRWMAQWLDLTCIIFSLGASIFCIVSKGSLPDELLAFTLQILTDVLIFFSFSMRMAAEIEAYFTSS